MKKKIRKFVHLVYIPFTGVGLYGGYRGDEWFQWRIDIFKEYTLKSLKAQTEKNFVVWISFRAQEKDNPLVGQIALLLKQNNIEYIFTFDGLMYWDDKYSPDLYSKLMNCARVVRGCYRNTTWDDLFPTIKEILFNKKNETLEARVQKSVDKIRIYFPEVETVYMTRVDSDDMLHRNYIKTVQHTRELTGACVCKNGYIFNGDMLASYTPKTNPPFHTIIFPAEIFFYGRTHVEYYGGYKSHEDVPKIFQERLTVLPDGYYCVTVHSLQNQISTIFNHPFRGDVIEEKEPILKQFGL